MANIGLGDLVQITSVCSYQNQVYMNTFPHIVSAVTGTVSQAAAFTALDLALSATGKLWDRYIRALTDQVTQDYVWYQVVRPVRYRKFVHTGAGPGQLEGTFQSTGNVQASISRYGELANKHDRGAIRMIAPTDDSYIHNGKITDAYKLLLLPLSGEMFSVTTAGGVTFTPVTGLVSPSWTPIKVQSTQVHDTVRVIRRRTVGVGI